MKPNIQPPDWVFKVVWPILYFTIFISGLLCIGKCSTIGWTSAFGGSLPVRATFFYLQLFFNLIWTTIFFGFKKPLIAFADLILIITFTVLFMVETNNVILIPYLLWLLFAGYLNYLYI